MAKTRSRYEIMRGLNFHTKEDRYRHEIVKGTNAKKLFQIPAGNKNTGLTFFVNKRGYRQFKTIGSIDAKHVRYEQEVNPIRQIWRIRKVRW